MPFWSLNRLTKSVCFIPVMIIYTSERLAQVYMEEIVQLYGLPISIISIKVLSPICIFGERYMVSWVSG